MANEPPVTDVSKVWQNQSVEVVQMSLDEIRKKAQKFTTRILWRNVGEYLGAVLAIACFGYYFWRFEGILLRTGSALVIAGTLYVVYQLRKRGSAKTVPSDMALTTCLEFHRSQLRKQRDLLQGVWSWYLLPLVPGMVVFLVGSAVEHPPANWTPLSVTVASCVVLLLLIGKLNQWAARRLQHQIDALDGLEKES